MRTQQIEFLKSAVIVPLGHIEIAVLPKLGSFDGGVYYASGEICEQGLQRKTHYRNLPGDLPAGKFSCLPGQHIFGGMLQEHFGHFLVESLGRIWAARQLAAEFDSVVFYPRIPGGRLPGFARTIFDLIIPGKAITILVEPTELERLAVPSQIEQQGMLHGHPLMRDVLAPLRHLGGGSARRLYVSRAGLPPQEGGLLLEAQVEANLVAAGYAVLRPETMPLREQLAAYTAADELVFAEGSALHLYALVARPEQRVFVIWRRKVAGHFEWQVRSFGGPTRLHGLPCIQYLLVPPGGEVAAKAVLDFGQLRTQLQQTGFIQDQGWQAPTEAEIAAEQARLTQATRRDYSKRQPTPPQG